MQRYYPDISKIPSELSYQIYLHVCLVREITPGSSQGLLDRAERNSTGVLRSYVPPNAVFGAYVHVRERAAVCR